MRTASVARTVYLQPGVGLGALTRAYGGSVNRGSRPSHHVDGSGSVARHALKSLEKLKVIENDETNGYGI